jgi:CspA family cold shock protein
MVRKSMKKRIKGSIIKFGNKGYGFILSDSGEKYFLHQKNVFGQVRLKLETRVIFTPKVSEKGLVAVDVNIVKLEISSKKPLSRAVVKSMFLFLLLMQIITFYYLFIHVN